MALRSSMHLVKGKAAARASTPEPGGVPLPPSLRREAAVPYDVDTYVLRGCVQALLRRVGPTLGGFANDTLESFVPKGSKFFKSTAQQRLLTEAVLADAAFLALYQRLVHEVVLPDLARRLEASEMAVTRFYYQFPPTMRVQPPGERYIVPHNDASYGHQPGEVNFWMPLTDYSLTETTLWVETAENEGDYHPVEVTHGEIASFHGTKCRHHVPKNPSSYTRVSVDFRVGVDGCYDPDWVMRGTSADHGRRVADWDERAGVFATANGLGVSGGRDATWSDGRGEGRAFQPAAR